MRWLRAVGGDVVEELSVPSGFFYDAGEDSSTTRRGEQMRRQWSLSASLREGGRQREMPCRRVRDRSQNENTRRTVCVLALEGSIDLPCLSTHKNVEPQGGFGPGIKGIDVAAEDLIMLDR